MADAPLALVDTPSVEAALDLVDALAPEHLELHFEGADADVAGARVAGCVFVGAAAATAFGDYAAGSNHVLPTGGAARFAGRWARGPFMRRTSVVALDRRRRRRSPPPWTRSRGPRGCPCTASRHGRGRKQETR